MTTSIEALLGKIESRLQTLEDHFLVLQGSSHAQQSYSAHNLAELSASLAVITNNLREVGEWIKREPNLTLQETYRSRLQAARTKHTAILVDA